MEFIIYQQSTGKFWVDGKPAATGYSGNFEGRNKNAFEHDNRIGPIPLGVYSIVTTTEGSEGTDYTFQLKAQKGSEGAKRSDLAITGNAATNRPCGNVYAPRRFRYDLAVNVDKFKYLIVIQ